MTSLRPARRGGSPARSYEPAIPRVKIGIQAIIHMQSRDPEPDHPPLSDVIERNIQNQVRLRNEAASGRTFQERMADAITGFSGSMSFVYLHALWFGLWVLLNTGWFGIPPFDPFPYSLLTMIVSLEAIFLSTFVLISQNRTALRPTPRRSGAARRAVHRARSHAGAPDARRDPGTARRRERSARATWRSWKWKPSPKMCSPRSSVCDGSSIRTDGCASRCQPLRKIGDLPVSHCMMNR